MKNSEENISVQFLSKALLEDIDETSVSSGVGSYQARSGMGADKYKKHPGERTTGGMIYKDLWEYEDSDLSVIIDDIRSHLATSSALKTSTKLEALDIANQIKTGIEEGNWEEVFVMLEELQEMLMQENPGEYEEVYLEMIEKAIRKVATFYDEEVSPAEEEDLEEIFSSEEKEKVNQLLNKLEIIDPKAYRKLLMAIIDNRPYKYSDAEAELAGNLGLSEEREEVFPTRKKEKIYIPDNIKKFAKTKGATSTVNKIALWAKKAGKSIVGGTAIGKHYSTLSLDLLDLTYEGGEVSIDKVSIDTDNNAIKVNGHLVTDYMGFQKALVSKRIYENYSRFKNETKTRPKEDQFHQAIRQVKKRVHEIHKVLEYVNRLKEDLTEDESGLKYRKHTEGAIAKIKEMVSELNHKIKKFK